MTPKRPIDIKRESGGSFTVGSPDDATPITDLLKLNDSLLVITKKAVYEIKLADQIDPKRENPNIPHNIQKCILNIGSDSELFGRILLTANILFKKEYLPESFDIEKAFSLSYEVLVEMLAMDTIAKEYKLTEKKAFELAENREEKDRSFAIPSVTDVKTRCKTFFQKGDHVEQIIRDIIRLSYTELKTKYNFDDFHSFITGKYGKEDDFTKFIEEILPFLKFVRNTRDCLDHRNVKGVDVKDFTLLADGKIKLPSIEVNFRGTHQPPVPLSICMPLVVENMLYVVELLFAFLCSKHAESCTDFSIQVGLIPEDRRRNKFVKYGYWTSIGGEILPIG